MTKTFLPINKADLKERGWNEVDILLISGDAYIDHPACGAALIGRWLEHLGYRVGIIAQPDWHATRNFVRLGRPRLFVGITSGNVDSMVAHYTAAKRKRSDDSFSPGGKAGLRPDRAVITYANRIREAFGDIPIIIGGIEASLRRFTHYDYWQDKVRRSILFDSRADLLVFGSGEQQIQKIAKALDQGKYIGSLTNIPGTAYIAKNLPNENSTPSWPPPSRGRNMKGWKQPSFDHVTLPSYEEVSKSKASFSEAFKLMYQEQDPLRGRTVAQPCMNRFLVQNPPTPPLSSTMLDTIYSLPFTKKAHPSYKKQGGVPALATFQCSITSHRGCCGECSFCSLALHQGRIVQSRSEASIIKEVNKLVNMPFFRGTVTDIGGPTANMYQVWCTQWESKGACKEKHCLTPNICGKLKKGHSKQIRLLKKVKAIPGVKHVFIATGLRYDLVLDEKDDTYLTELCENFISGQLKVAPEHSVDRVLKLMNKPPNKRFEEFIKKYEAINKKLGKKQYLLPYLISGYPGCTENDMKELLQFLKSIRFIPRQVQQFTPSPMTMATCMYYTGLHPFTGEKVRVARSKEEQKKQRSVLTVKRTKPWPKTDQRV